MVPADSLTIVEFLEVATGLEAADRLVKAAPVELVIGQPVCPGNFLVVLAGEAAAARTAMDLARELYASCLWDSFYASRLHPSVIEALAPDERPEPAGALGVIETYSVGTAVLAGDVAVKGAPVDLIEIRTANGMGGRCFLALSGEVDAVQEAVELGSSLAATEGLLADRVVIAAPSPELLRCVGGHFEYLPLNGADCS